MGHAEVVKGSATAEAVARAFKMCAACLEAETLSTLTKTAMMSKIDAEMEPAAGQNAAVEADEEQMAEENQQQQEEGEEEEEKEEDILEE